MDTHETWLQLHQPEQDATLRRRADAAEFGRLHGWTPSLRAFSFRALAAGGSLGDLAYHYRRTSDHPYFYRSAGRPAAIACHLYDWPDAEVDCRLFAAHYGVELIVPDFGSWWNPPATTLVVYARAVPR